MGQGNGLDRDAENTERLISLVARLNDALRDFSEEQRRSSERLGRVESAVDKVWERITEVRHHVEEARDDIREGTNPRFKLPGAQGSIKQDGDGFEITDKQVRLPSTWIVVVLKAAMSAGGGALLLRAVQWFATRH